jgi:hypothetical protein
MSLFSIFDLGNIFCKGKLQESMTSVVNVAEVLTRSYSRESYYKKSYET